MPIRKVFDYQAPPVPIGARVRVEFGRRKMIGIVVCQTQSSAVELSKIKAIDDCIDEEPVFNADMLALGQWLADYQHQSLGETLFTMLPAALRKNEPNRLPVKIEYRITETGLAQLDTSIRAKQQHALLTVLSSAPQEINDIRRQFSRAVIKACEHKGWIVSSESAMKYSCNWVTNICVKGKVVPNTEQALAISNIALHQDNFRAFLLEGITGSGKTEVFLQAIEPVLLAGKQVLVLVPEIGLTPQTVQRFEERFGIEVGVLHSGLSDRQRLSMWQRARAGDLGLIIGTRSSVFTAFDNLGMIIVDEEHDESYKQQDGIRYHARDIAVIRAKRLNVPLIMGSATPSLESINNALQNKYQLLELTQRTGSARLAKQQIIDIKRLPLQYGLSVPVLQKMQTHLEKGNQVLVFINRRGFAPSLVCHHCGHVYQCERCDAPYTIHKAVGRLHCHRCDNIQRIPTRCGSCGNTELLAQGVGTEQLEQGLGKLFINAKVIRVDSDSVRGKDKLAQVIQDINNNRYQILIGTQILSKGHHFPRVSLVVVMDVDAGLFSVDVRASEKLAQLITQLSGRAGRESVGGETLLQTHHPEHPLLQDLVNNGYQHFSRHALAERKAANAPPYTQQIVFRAESNNPQLSHNFLLSVGDLLSAYPSLQIIGPLPASMYKKAGRFRLLLIIQAQKRTEIHHAVRHQMAQIENMPLASKVRWHIDVAPTDLS